MLSFDRFFLILLSDWAVLVFFVFLLIQLLNVIVISGVVLGMAAELVRSWACFTETLVLPRGALTTEQVFVWAFLHHHFRGCFVAFALFPSFSSPAGLMSRRSRRNVQQAIGRERSGRLVARSTARQGFAKTRTAG